MNMILNYTLALTAGLSLAFFAIPAAAQIQHYSAAQSVHTPAVTAATPHKMETLSGIHLQPTKQGTYELDFSQELKEDAVLEIMNKAGKVVYQQPLSIADSTFSWHFDVGALRTDNYQIAVRTSDTTYWSMFKVRNASQAQAKKKRK